MKWLKFKDDMEPGMSSGRMKKFMEPIQRPKVPIKTTDMLEKKFGEKFEEWATYPEPGDTVLLKLGKIAVRKYEVFCGGFLYYHDVDLKNYPMDPNKKYPVGTTGYPDYPVNKDNKFDHKIFFEWFPKGKNTPKNKVIIYINFTPPQYNPNPPKPPGPPPPES